jgi:hypothetical protein
MERRSSTAAPVEVPAIPEPERERRLKLLAERLLSPDGFDRETLEQLETLTDRDA